MERGKRIDMRPMDEAFILEFEDEIKKLTDLGLSEVNAGCYISNYYDDFICDQFIGKCKSIEECKRIHDILRKDNNE